MIGRINSPYQVGRMNQTAKRKADDGGDLMLTPVADTYVANINNGERNYGVRGTIVFTTATTHKGLMKFDLSSFLGSTILAAKLRLTQTVSGKSRAERPFNVYGITAANGDWIEGGGADSLAADGEPCWNAKQANGAGGIKTAWAGSAGLSTAGVDYDNTILATADVTRYHAAGYVHEIPFTAAGIAVLQSWANTPANNYGVLLIATDNFTTIASRQHPNQLYRPILQITI